MSKHLVFYFSNAALVSKFSRPDHLLIQQRCRLMTQTAPIKLQSVRKEADQRSMWPLGTLKRVKNFVLDYYLPIASLLSMTIGYLYPTPGVYLNKHNFTNFCTIGVFVVSGLLLESGEATNALDSSGSLLIGLILILGLTPLLAPLIMKIPLHPTELSLGVATFILTPTTLSSGVTLIQAAGANVAMALLLTIASNFLAVFTIPVSLFFLLGFTTQTSSPLVLFKKLVHSVLAPMSLAYLAKILIPECHGWIRKRKKTISYLGTAFLMMIPWMQVSCVSRSGVSLTFTSLASAVCLGTTAHLLFLTANHFIVHNLQLGGNEPKQALAIRRSVILMSSQKSLTIAIALLTQLTPYLGAEKIGIACIPCVLIHFSQTIIDSILASHWAKCRHP